MLFTLGFRGCYCITVNGIFQRQLRDQGEDYVASLHAKEYGKGVVCPKIEIAPRPTLCAAATQRRQTHRNPLPTRTSAAVTPSRRRSP